MATTNPFRIVPKVKRQKRDEEGEDVFEPLSFEELDKVIQYFQVQKHRNFLRFLSMILCAWARPVEICRLRVEDIDLSNDVIRFKSGKTKNGKGAYVQIIPQLKKILLEMDLHKYDKRLFVFSTVDYMPGPKQKNPERPLEKWNWHVVGRLKIEKKMYALKHTGNIEYLLRNKGRVDLKWQQMQNRHSDAGMTERYNRKLGAYFIDCGELNFREL